jgi:hypothetical protein
MKLGDFFSSAATCQPVNPKPVSFVLIAKGNILPGGQKNNNKGGAYRAQATAAMVFIGGDETKTARLDTRKALREEFRDEKGMPLPYDDGDYDLELMYQILHRALREWDEKEHETGAPLFESVANIREFLIPREANRLMQIYNDYVKSEHPEEGPDKASFRGDEGRGEGASRT